MRPTGTLMNHPGMYQDCHRNDHSTAEWLGARVVSLSSNMQIEEAE